jgi:putative FmdB family regulatory protein
VPIYEFRCEPCGFNDEIVRRMADRAKPHHCPRGHVMERIFSIAALSIWDADRPFTNAVAFGDGKFPTRQAYESHLKAHDMAESKIDGRNKSKVPRSMRA